MCINIYFKMYMNEFDSLSFGKRQSLTLSSRPTLLLHTLQMNPLQGPILGPLAPMGPSGYIYIYIYIYS